MAQSETVIQKNTGKTFVVKKGRIIRVTGESTADFVVFNLGDVSERFDQARTKVDQGKIYVTTGDVLISKYNNVMMTIIKDTYRGTHDMEKGMCSTSFYKKWGDKIFAIYGGKRERRRPERGGAPQDGSWEKPPPGRPAQKGAQGAPAGPAQNFFNKGIKAKPRAPRAPRRRA